MKENQLKTHVCKTLSREYMKKKIFPLSHKGVDTLCEFFFLKFSFRHSIFHFKEIIFFFKDECHYVIWFDEYHYVIHIITDFIFLLNSCCVTIMIKVKQSMAAVNKVCFLTSS